MVQILTGSHLVKMDWCPKQFHLYKTQRKSAESFNEFSMEKISSVSRIKELAMNTFPDLIHIDAPRWTPERTARVTARTLSNHDTSVVTGGQFYAPALPGGTLPLVQGADILVRIPDYLIVEAYDKLKRLFEILKKSPDLTANEVNDLYLETFALETDYERLYDFSLHLWSLRWLLLVKLYLENNSSGDLENFCEILNLLKSKSVEARGRYGVQDGFSQIINFLETSLKNQKVDLEMWVDLVFSYEDVLQKETVHFVELGLVDVVNVGVSLSLFDRGGEFRSDKRDQLLRLSSAVYAARSQGVPVNRSQIMHLNSEYKHPQNGCDFDLSTLFVSADLTSRVDGFLPEVHRLRQQATKVLISSQGIDQVFDEHCRQNGRLCDFSTHCSEDLPEHHLSSLYYQKPELQLKMRAAGIDDLDDPEIFAKIEQFNRGKKRGLIRLSVQQKRMIQSLQSGELILDRSGLKSALNHLQGEIHFMDFETLFGALPVLKGQSPFTQIPLQVSNHVRLSNGDLQHREFLTSADLDKDLIREFAENLIHIMRGADHVVVYNLRFEKSCLLYLAERCPDLKDDLMKIESKLFDLLVLVRDYIYHPDFKGSFSIKTVLPALVPELTYNDLEIRDGTQAAFVLDHLLQASLQKSEKESLRYDLKEYCGLDSWAMVKIFEWMMLQV